MSHRHLGRLQLAAIGAVSLSQAGCYLTTSALEEAKILARRRPISAIVNDARVDSATRRKLELVLSARGYAKDSIALDAKEAFTSFAQLDRDTLVLVLSAAYQDRLEAYTWRFPIVGRVPYKGYFDFAAARREAGTLSSRGFDIYLRPSDAFSTLGWFNDPVLSTTLARDSLELVKTVIHELTHNTFYAPGQAEFNESFASFVGSRGAAAFFRSQGLPDAAAMADARWDDEKLLGSFWAALVGRLDSAFARHPSDRAARLAVRDSIYASARDALTYDVVLRLQTVSPRYAERVPLNNAWLLAQRIYGKDLEVFDRVWKRENRDLRRTVARIVALAKSQPGRPFEALGAWLSAKP